MDSVVTTIILAGGKSERMGTDKALLQLNHKTLLQLTCEAAACCSDRILIVSSESQNFDHLPLPKNCQFVLESVRSSPLQAFQLGMEQAFFDSNIFDLNFANQSIQSSDLEVNLGLNLRHNLEPESSNYHSNWFLLLACDLPNLNGETLHSWTQELADLGCYDAYLALNDQLSESLRNQPSCKLSDRSSKKSTIKSQGHFPSQQSFGKSKLWQPLCGFYRFDCYNSLTNYLNKENLTESKFSYSFQDWLSQINICPIKNVPPGMLFNCNYSQDWQLVLTEYEAKHK